MRLRLATLTVVLALVIAPRAPAQAQTQAQAQAPKSAEVLTNQSVVQMVLAKVPKDVIQAKVQSTRSDFDISVSGLIGLQANKVSADLMKAMMSAGAKKPSTEVLTNESVINMVASKLPKDVILAKIQSTKKNFDITSDGLVSLNTNKVPKEVVTVMMAAGH
ncbi:MAG TPA: hypothetical protein VGM20_00010 [Gemmatimonadales bacterium]|jgi:hypothetical protein